MGKGSKLKHPDNHFKIYLEVGKAVLLLANLAGGSLIFGQAVAEKPFQLGIAVFGAVFVTWLYSLAVLIMKRGGEIKK